MPFFSQKRIKSRKKIKKCISLLEFLQYVCFIMHREVISREITAGKFNSGAFE